MKKAVLLGLLLGIVGMFITAKPYVSSWASDWRLADKVVKSPFSYDVNRYATPVPMEVFEDGVKSGALSEFK